MSQTFDLAKLAQDNPEPSSDNDSDTTALTPISSGYSVIQHQDLAWVEATQGLQRTVIRSLQDYKMSWLERRAIATQRERLIAEVTEQYVNYLKEEAKMSSKVAIQARDSMLRQELAKMRAKLFVELAEITGSAVVEIERLAQTYTSKIVSPVIQQAYAKFVITKIFALLEHNEGS